MKNARRSPGIKGKSLRIKPCSWHKHADSTENEISKWNSRHKIFESIGAVEFSPSYIDKRKMALVVGRILCAVEIPVSLGIVNEFPLLVKFAGMLTESMLFEKYYASYKCYWRMMSAIWINHDTHLRFGKMFGWDKLNHMNRLVIQTGYFPLFL